MALAQVDVVLKANADVAAHYDSGGGHVPGAAADAGDGPGGTGGDLLD